jgi:CRP-like cAMP-binding protein
MLVNESEETELLKILGNSFATKSFSKGQYLYNQGESPEYLYHIKSGLVGLLRSTEAGNESLLRLFKTDQFFGHRTLFSDETYHASSKCLEDCQIKLIPKKKAIEFFNETPMAYAYLAKSLAKELRRAEVRSVTVSEGDILQRVASALILFKTLKPDHLWTRKEIANYCASRTPTIITAMSKLEAKGAISQHKREIRIENMDILESLI